jgi:hypothetical protein
MFIGPALNLRISSAEDLTLNEAYPNPPSHSYTEQMSQSTRSEVAKGQRVSKKVHELRTTIFVVKGRQIHDWKWH